jgi:AcrR family transcriptional regulator
MDGPASLRARLVETALTEIEAGGVDATSLRNVATEAGVSRQAPYLCFPDKRAMLAAAAAEVLRRERSRWSAALARAGTSASARLIALALAHARFAESHPNLHALAWGPYVAKADAPELQSEAIECFSLLRDTVAACLPDDAPATEQRSCALVAWATVKGLVDLRAHRQIPASVDAPLDDLVADAIRMLVAGWLARKVPATGRERRRRLARR